MCELGPIFNEKVAEKRGLWVPWTVHGIHWCDIKQQKHASKKKKNVATQTQDTNAIQTRT